MRKNIKLILVTIICIAYHFAAQAQIAKTQVIMLNVTVQNSSITLNWPAATFTGTYQLFRRNNLSDGWGNSIAVFPSTTTTYIDNTVSKGKTVEYQIIKVENNQATALGFTYAGNMYSTNPYKGGILLLIDSNYQIPLQTELQQLSSDLTMEGWNVSHIYAGRNESVVNVKDRIKMAVSQAKHSVTTLFIIGHVPVPYSGVYSGSANFPPPDGHVEGSGDHTGAWCADAFYADLDGTWTDNETMTTGGQTRNHNNPNDGKYDQTRLPSDLELELGRLDLFNMPAFTMSDTALVQQYLNRNHAYRTQQIVYPNRALIDNNFGSLNLASSGYQNFSSFFIFDSIFDNKDYITTQTAEPYLWSFGCGGGSYTTCSGIGNTGDFATKDVKNIFTMLSGSFFGDWDVQNNFLRAPLAKNSLASFWGGIPKWYVHTMAMGKHIGYGTRATQNNTTNYFNGGFNNSFNLTTIALMGDPTLMNSHLPYVTNLNVSSSNNKVYLNWDGVKGNIEGYGIFRVDTSKNDYFYLGTVVDTFFVDAINWNSGIYTYTVRPTRKETTGSGSYINFGGGIYKNVNHINSLNIIQAPNIAIYPNPNKDGLVQVVAENIASIELMDILGRNVEHIFNGNLLDFSTSPSGTYLLKVSFINGSESVVKLQKL